VFSLHSSLFICSSGMVRPSLVSYHYRLQKHVPFFFKTPKMCESYINSRIFALPPGILALKECKHSPVCPFIVNDVVYSSDRQFQSTINLESCIIGSQKSVPPFVVHSRTSLICCSNCFDHHHHHHAQPIIF